MTIRLVPRRLPLLALIQSISKIVLCVLLCMASPSSARADARISPGWLLVAAPGLADPNFRHSVILLVRFGPGGGFGFVLNRPIGSGPLGTLLDGLGIETEQESVGTVRLFLGGPVDPQQGFVVHSADVTSASSQPLGDSGLRYSTDATLLSAIAAGAGPERYRLFFGYTGWGAGQLEAEVDRGDWRIAPLGTDDPFSEQPETLWEKTLKRAGTPL